MAVVILFIAHWQLSVFCQSFFLHRYGAHKQFSMSPGWERFFNVLTCVSQNSSYLNPRGYAILHRMHHAYSDTEKDPHSPHFSPDAMTMMLKTKHEYDDYAYERVAPEPRFDGGYPVWPAIDRLSQSWVARVAWMGIYSAVYWQFATVWWHWLLLPVQWVVGPVHGAIVNWCGHKYGYQNFDNGDRSRNMLWVDFLTAGELFQNNHHKFAMSPNFAARWFEIDPTYFAIRVLSALKIIQLKGGPRARYPMDAAEAAE
jgi:stearoyl-CoA desaturase (delta-9 desaturase)